MGYFVRLGLVLAVIMLLWIGIWTLAGFVVGFVSGTVTY